MPEFLNLVDFPIHTPQSAACADLVARCKSDLGHKGMFNLEGFLHRQVAEETAQDLAPRMHSEAFLHRRRHNIYFSRSVEGLPADHPALAQFQTSNLTLCADQLGGTALIPLYEWPPLRRFLAEVMGKPALFPMADPLARVNVMSYGQDDALNWHFDRSEFTTTLLLQAPRAGGEFEYRTDLRGPDDPNYDGVARLLAGKDPELQRMSVTPGTLNVFRGINTPHRVTAVKGDRARMIAVFSYFDRPSVVFSAEEQQGFYGRVAEP